MSHRPSRIAHVTDAYLPRLGGIETQVSGLAAQQVLAGHEVHVLTRTAVGAGGSPVPGLRVHRGPRAGLRQVLLAGGFDMVHVHASVISPLAMSLTAAASAAGLPVAVTVHSMWPDTPALVRPAGAGLRLGRRPVAWSAVSRAAAGPLRRALGADVRIDVLPNAVDVAWWRADRPGQSPNGASETVVTSLMRFSLRKRPLALLRVMHEVRRLVPTEVAVRLVVAGDGSQLGRVRRSVRAHGMADWVDLPGRLAREDARRLLHRSHVYVAPADLESFGIAALEARAAGVPVVAKRGGGVREFVTNGTEGLLADDDEQLAAAVARLVVDAELRRRIAAHNAAVPPLCTWDLVLSRTETLYARAAALAGRPAHPAEVQR